MSGRSLAIGCSVGIILVLGSVQAGPLDPRCGTYAEAVNNLFHETREARAYRDPQYVIAAQNGAESGMHWANIELNEFVGSEAASRALGTPEFLSTVERMAEAEDAALVAQSDGTFALLAALHRFSDAMVAVHESAYVALCGSAD